MLLLSYTISTLGVGIREFYCCGMLKSVDIAYATERKESCLKEDKTGGCCETSLHFLKVNDSHFGSDGIANPTVPFADHLSAVPSFDAVLIAPFFLMHGSRSHAPPIHRKAPIYILHCVYRV